MDTIAKTIKIITAIATLLTAIAMLAFAIWGLFIPHVGLSMVCFALVIFLAFFIRNDYYYFFQKKETNDQTKQM